MPADRLNEYLQAKAGEFFRAIIQYDANSYELVYVRDDIDQGALRQRVEHARERIIAQSSDETGEEFFGQTYATLHVREYAFILNLRWSPTEGFLIGLEPDAASDLVAFIHETIEYGIPDEPSSTEEPE